MSLQNTTDINEHFQGLIERYQCRREPISVDFRKIVPWMNSADRYTHLIHSYPAKLLMHIPFYFLSNTLLSTPGDVVLDPFSGSGTVLLESVLANRIALGVDVNPFARLISKVKTRPINPKVLKRAEKSLMNRIADIPKQPTPDVVNLNYWFNNRVINQLRCLLEAIHKTRNEDVRNFFLVNFSNCMGKVSYADPRVSVPVRLRSNQYQKGHRLREKVKKYLKSLDTIEIRNVFEEILKMNIIRMEKYYETVGENPDVEILCSKADNLIYEYSKNGQQNNSLPDNSVQLIITSPPYPGAQKYIRSSSLSLGWLGLCATSDFVKIKNQVIGREEFRKAEYAELTTTGIQSADLLLEKIYSKNMKRAAIAGSYVNEMRAVIKELYRVLKPGGTFVLIAANNMICEEKFKTQEYLCQISNDVGFEESLILIDHIKSRGLMTKRNSTASVITREYIMVFKKD